MNRILCIDETSIISENLSKWLSADNIIIDLCADADCLERITRSSYNMIIVNASTDIDWIFTLRSIRQKSFIPIIVLAEKHNTVDMVTALRSGADEYISLSTDILEISLRVKSLLRRCNEYFQNINRQTNQSMTFNNLRISVSERTVWKNDVEVDLTKTEFELLYFLARHKGQTLSREQLCENVWSDEYVVDDKSIISHIYRLRTKIEDKPSEPEYILTVRGDGYKFNSNTK